MSSSLAFKQLLHWLLLCHKSLGFLIHSISFEIRALVIQTCPKKYAATLHELAPGLEAGSRNLAAASFDMSLFCGQFLCGSLVRGCKIWSVPIHRVGCRGARYVGEWGGTFSHLPIDSSNVSLMARQMFLHRNRHLRKCRDKWASYYPPSKPKIGNDVTWVRASARLTEHCSFLAFSSLRVLIHNPASTNPPLAEYSATARYLMLTAQNAWNG